LFVTPDAANRDVFDGVNFEFSFNTAHWNERRYTSEIRAIIGTHIGRFDFIFDEGPLTALHSRTAGLDSC
jgi:hypothetical protein